MDSVLERIYRSSLKFLVPLGPEETYKLIVDEAVKLVKGDYGSILLEQQGELVRVYASNPNLNKIKPRKRDFTYKVFKDRRPKIMSAKDVSQIHNLFKEMTIKSILLVPLFYRNKSIGVLSVDSFKTNFFTDKEKSLLQLFSPLASLAIRKTQLYDVTKKALDARDLFISMAAHELRTPLTTINGYTQLLHSKLSGADSPESRWIEELSWEILRLTQLVNELLAVDRIKAGELHYILKECSLRQIVKRAALDFRFTHPSHQLAIQDKLAGDKDTVVGDFDKLLQVTINLLDNAAKFSPENSQIIVTLRRQQPNLVIDIRDQGKGIAKKDLPKVFDGFYQGDNHSREGMGLGLFLAKNIIKQHRGDIKVYSRENRGTNVEIRLPGSKI